MNFGDIPDLARERSYPTPFQNSSLLPLLLLSLMKQKHTPNTKRSFKSKYDYIVVGAGSAGCVIAACLSEDKDKTVLLLEAGSAPPVLTELPAISDFFHGSDIHWNYFTEPQKYAAQGHENRSVTSPTGKCLGGSSAVNGMFYIRGNRKDYRTWESLGATGWSWDEILHYFRKPENNTDPDIANNGFHSVGGPLTVGRYPSNSEFKQPLIDVVTNLGYPYRDSNGARQTGFNDFQGNIRRGQRCSTAKAYLVPNENRTNLDIVTDAYVTKVRIHSRRAVGVQFDYKNRSYEVDARCEVILCAGALKTPQLLMLSGIGPKRILEKFGIPVIQDLPVGENFQDHAASIANFVATKDCPLFVEKLQDYKNIMKYIDTRTGPLAGPSGIFGMGFLADNKQAQQNDLPTSHLYFFEGSWGNFPPFGLSRKVYDQLYGPYLQNATVFCVSQDLYPKSQGCVGLRSANPYDSPKVDPNYYENIEDLKHVVSGLKECDRIMRDFKKCGFKPFETLMPGCEDLVADEDEYLRCYARTMVASVSHQVGTARMGDPRDPTTVVDPQLRVKNIECLRVVDASVIPKIPRANTNNPVIMIAEKACDIIKGKH